MARRHAGTRFIGIDLAGGMRRAALQAHAVPNLRYVQGNLLEPPLARDAFDFAYSFGVLHHTRNPRAAFLALVERLRPGGRITLFVYKDFSDLPWKKMLLAPVTLARRVSTRLPAPVLRALAWCGAPVVFVALTLPARLLRAVRLPHLAQHIPYGTFPGIRGIAASLEDRFGAPYEHRFRIADLQEWAQAAGLEEARVVDCLPWGFSGLVLSGRAPALPANSGHQAVANQASRKD
jgi:SAM-dependent methyltransferase